MKSLIFAALLVAATALGASAQQAGVDLSEAGAIQLRSDAPVESRYVLELQDLNLSDEAAATAHSIALSGELVTFRSLWSAGKMLVFLNTGLRPEWSTAQWNAYLAEMPVTYTSPELNHQN